MAMLTNRSWKLAARPQGAFKREDFQWAEEPVPDLADGQVLVRVVYLSLDPTNRGWANATATYLPPIPLGSVMRGFGLGVVEASRHAALRPGDYVQGMLGWQAYAVLDGGAVTRFEREPGIPLDAYPSVFSFIGATAYFGLLDIGRPKQGETLVVSGAAGAVGSLVGQIGKIVGCRVVGIAGSDEKCQWLTGELGFDAAINYKRESVLRRLRQHCPKGIDVCFENVGGEILDAALALINERARIALCGLISQYNESVPPPGPRFFGNLLIKRARVEGFIILDYASRFPEAFTALGKWYQQGLLRYRTDMVDGLEQAPVAINRLFDLEAPSGRIE
jgi:NADPH-dependent curcumin reductase CurA